MVVLFDVLARTSLSMGKREGLSTPADRSCLQVSALSIYFFTLKSICCI